MKKVAIIFTVIVLVTSLIIIAFNFYPKEVNIDTQGIRYRLGNEHNEIEKLVNVNIEGKLHKSIFGERSFTGTIEIEDDQLPVPLDQRQLKILFSSDGWGVINYIVPILKPNGAMESVEIYQYGSIFLNKDLNKVTILISDHDPISMDSVGWSSENGLMITAPASNRLEALTISNELMKLHLRGLKLE